MRSCFRLLTFRASEQELVEMCGGRFLAFGIFCTWLVGMGRWWDDPGAQWFQHLGLGSLAYVFVMGSLLWMVMGPLRPHHWSWLRVVTFVTLTAPPAALYAIPVERFLTMSQATSVNVWFLLLVASWRVALLLFYLRRLGGLRPVAILCGGLLPLAAIVNVLTILNLERAVFEIMGGLGREGTPNDGAYAVLILITVLSWYAAIPLLLLYVGCVYFAWRRPAVSDSPDA
ncbi:MAG: hypothetical protein J0I12_16860 [Candidatus Eremiobacteraeota bacterium]|nr:hypothetical protein [Candidatus Eremiobacteraeota bacterium]